MTAPSTPSNFLVQEGNGQVYLSWNQLASVTSYYVYRSSDNITYSNIATPTTPYYLDTSVTVGTQYFYQVASYNGTLSPVTNSANIVPTRSAVMTLGQVRQLAIWYADKQNSNFITIPEWNTYINQSYFELYDLLVQKYGNDYYVSTFSFPTDGISQNYPFPNDFYKLLGVDLAINPNNNAWVTLKRFNFIARNRFIFPNITANYLGVANLQYRPLGNNIEFIPTPASGQTIKLWYIPKMTQLLQDTDQLDGISGWTEYVAIDVAIKAQRKEESYEAVQALMIMKQSLIDRIESAAENRDAGEPETVSDTRRYTDPYGWGSPNGDGPYGGF
jgi:hypothetical protein